MIRNFFSILLLPAVFTFYSSFVSAQDTFQVSDSSSNGAHLAEDSVHQRMQVYHPNHYLKPSALIVPGALLIYGGLKPVINAIPKLDDRIMAHVQANYPSFHTNAADYLMWVPSASVYAMDAFPGCHSRYHTDIL